MTLKKYLTFGIIGSLALTIVLGIAITFLFTTIINLKATLTDQNELTLLVSELEDMSSYLKTEARLYSFTGNEAHLANYNAMVEKKLFAGAEERFNEMGVPADITAYLAQINNASLTAAEQEYLAFEEVKSGDLVAAQTYVFNARYEEETAYVYVLYDEFKEKLDAWNTDTVANVQASANIALLIIIVTALLFAITIIAILVLIAKKVRPLYQLTNHAKMIAKGDLTVETVQVTSNDEIGQLSTSFNTMVENLRNILATVNQSSVEVAASSEQLLANAEQTSTISKQVASSVNDIAQEATQQQLQMTENAAALAEVTVGIQQVASAAEDVSEASTEAKERAIIGKNHLSSTVAQMHSIKSSVDETIHVIEDLSKHSQEIEEFVTAITEISNQTNLLALNAAIEAARAGELGKGFAVVADEVRKLAEQSNQSASRITDIIQSLQGKVRQTTDYMMHVTKQVEEGVDTVTQTGRSFEAIMQSTTAVSDQITGVSAIAQQMAASTEQMSAIFESLQTISSQTAHNSQSSVQLVNNQDEAIQEITTSSAMLTKLAENLNNEVTKFTL